MSPHPRVGETGFSASFFFCLFLMGGPSWPGSRGRVRPPASPRAERMGIRAASFQDEGGLLERFSSAGRAPRRQGDGTKGRLQGTIVGRLVTVPGSGQAHRAPCVCAWLGWALQPGFPCWFPISAHGLLFAPLPTP